MRVPFAYIFRPGAGRKRKRDIVKQLVFGCELDTDELQEMFATPTVLDTLIELGAGVGLAVIDLSAERAAVVRHLNDAGVPVAAWLVLPREEGYWFNADNAPEATARYKQFRAWTAEYGLRWEGIGLDVEPDFNEVKQLLGKERWQILPVMLRRAFDRERLHRAETAYRVLVEQIRADGYRVETCQFPFIVDERKAGAWLLQRVFGLVDMKADGELLMLYSSFAPAIGDGLLWSYAPDAEGIIVGITGNGVEPDGMAVPMTWAEFSRDLRLAAHWRDLIFVYSLEGCVQQGFLERLRTFDWEEPVVVPHKRARQINTARMAVQAGLWASAHTSLILMGMLSLVSLFSFLLRPGGRRKLATP
jgi:hypothetical protein